MKDNEENWLRGSLLPAIKMHIPNNKNAGNEFKIFECFQGCSDYENGELTL